LHKSYELSIPAGICRDFFVLLMMPLSAIVAMAHWDSRASRFAVLCTLDSLCAMAELLAGGIRDITRQTGAGIGNG